MLRSLATLQTRPLVQNLIAGTVLFGTVGIYVAIANLGAGAGKPNSLTMNYITSSTLYGIFAISGFFAGSIINRFGPKYAVMLGASGYPLYVTGLLLFDEYDILVLPILGAVALGFSAGQLWAGVNYIAMAYADEHEKGRFYGFQAAMQAFGNLVAACLVLGINISNVSSGGVPLSVYLTFIGIMCGATALTWFLIKPEDVRRKDGTALAIYKHESLIKEVVSVCKLVFDWKAMALAPALFVTEFVLILQPGISAVYFDLRTRCLVAVISGVVSTIGAFSMGMLLDWPRLSRPTRARVGFCVLASIIVSIYSGEGGWLYNDLPQDEPEDNPAYDWTSSHFAGFFVLDVLFSTVGAMSPVYVAWLLASLTNDPRKSGQYAGLIRSVMAAGTAVAFGIAAGGTSDRHQWIVHTVLQFAALVPQAVVAFTQITETNYGKEELVIIPESIVPEIEARQPNKALGAGDGSFAEKVRELEPFV
ncbi:hypothetical protein A1O1_06354 [Capronia coronata CBS 617.96]|uniref:Major facilitator superfamily (MFS) profile domain-containing protein n=1 Tax=Capronia coronata CBS 617.96 TaxID=1182541 RepID=W9Y8M7_9EURO|nr:uncharacterized protein A1O1_06354 [Capronia coronata CBS 617.96]EXJ85985.1 hypothetical protein A1O1_06354 [Capronia coronata CBS 617.96]